MNQIPTYFPITIFEDVASDKVTETITKKRCGIFYKGGNRNGSYISDEFAEKLIGTLPYAPVKGIYNEEEEDFTTHGSARTEGRIYGVVPSKNEMNFAWEKHLDPDGIEREYACADVYLYTALYSEASKIDGKGQSMELYPPSIKGEWVNINGQRLYKYSEASFLGLQVLGDKAVPCFEGSSFFSLMTLDAFNSLFTTLVDKITELSRGDEQIMENEKLEFVLSANQTNDAISKALNTERFQYIVMDHYDDYAIVYDLETDKLLRVDYTKNEDDSITLAEEKVELTCEYVTAEEKTALDALRTKTEVQTFEAISAYIDAKNEKISEYETEINNKDNEIATLKSENEQSQNHVTELEGQLDGLKQFKKQVEDNEKEELFTKFSAKLSEEIINKYREKADEYSVFDLKRDLAMELVDNDASIFTVQTSEPAPAPKFVPQENPDKLTALLNKYKTNGGN